MTVGVEAGEELAREQAYVDRAYARLDVLRTQARRWSAHVLEQGAGGTPQARLDRDVLVHTSLRRLAQLAIGSGEPLVFGRLDRPGADPVYVGRIGVPDEDLDPLVVDWRAPAAAPFYRATAAEPLGLARRRHLRSRGRRLIGLDDEVFGGEDAATEGLVLVGEGALLDALRRERTGRMRDIVATIQREQDEVIRAPLEGALVVQGGPGTGKTAVALHRAAYLLYTERERLEEAGVLLVGPTARFVRYIADVLPSLGEESVQVTRLEDLVPGVEVTAWDPDPVAALKADGRMAAVLRRAVRATDLSGVAPEDWPRLPRVLLRRLLASEAQLSAAARSVLPRADQRLLRRPSDAGWTAADVPLLDELAALLAPRAPRAARRRPDDEGGRVDQALDAAGALDPGMRSALRARLRGGPGPRRGGSGPQRGGLGHEVFAHVLVDEAQDLSPMAWRMITRRCPGGSMTIVGDQAQRTAPGAAAGWEAVAATLPTGRVSVRELTVNYRTPREIADVAARVLAAAAAGVQTPRPVRTAGVEPAVRRVAADAWTAAVREAVTEAVGAGGLVGVLAPAGLVAGTAPVVARAAGERRRTSSPCPRRRGSSSTPLWSSSRATSSATTGYAASTSPSRARRSGSRSSPPGRCPPRWLRPPPPTAPARPTPPATPTRRRRTRGPRRTPAGPHRGADDLRARDRAHGVPAAHRRGAGRAGGDLGALARLAGVRGVRRHPVGGVPPAARLVHPQPRHRADPPSPSTGR